NNTATGYIDVLTGVTVPSGITAPTGGQTLAQYAANANTLISTIATDTAKVASSSDQIPSAPIVTTINVPDVAARLGNISVVADVLRTDGGGQLEAPGSATISIINNTADTLSFDNLSMPTYDAGHVRLNGALVDSPSEITAINAGHVASGFTSGNVVTSLTSSRPVIDITSNYNPQSGQFYVPGSSIKAFNTPMAPPDIVLNTNMAINNPNGTVNITSAAGDIYIYGKIDAGSLNILAKNGDFVSSYVDGFDHIGGDPASFNNHTDPSEAGIGIIANGAISISARYLNINSTIQSGIANWTANLGSSNDPELTTGTASLIGITDPSAITNAISDYISQLKAGGSISGTKTLTN